MHIGKNVSESLINTFLGTTEKSKDNLNSHLDLQALGIRSDLHPVEVDDQFYLPSVLVQPITLKEAPQSHARFRIKLGITPRNCAMSDCSTFSSGILAKFRSNGQTQFRDSLMLATKINSTFSL